MARTLTKPRTKSATAALTEPTTADVQAQLDKLKKDLMTLTDTVSNYGSHKADKLVERASETSDEIVDTSKKAVLAAREELETLETNVKTRVQENPLQAIGIAAGVGFLVALLARR